MKNLLLAGVATGALAIAGAAQAADLRMPVKAPLAAPPVFSWSGCYVGAHWGWGWGKEDGTGFRDSGAFTRYGTFDDKISGPIFGGQLGCNYQWPGSNFVIGVEGSYSAADINGHQPNSAATESGVGNAVKVTSLGSVTGRIGWNGWDPSVLFYAKGGWAFERERLNIGYGAPFNTSRDGWTAGGGIEWAFAFAPRWSAFVEYAHYDFGRKNVNFTSGCDNVGNLCHSRTKLNIDTVKIGVNYKFINPF
jgi:outer membrane immunogenic protein